MGSFGGQLRQCEKAVDAADTCNGRLDGLDFHAEAFYGSEDLGDIVHNRNSRTGRHTKQR